MGISKTELFTANQNKLAKMARALGHPARIAILEHLIAKGSCVCGDIVDELPLSQSTISQHLKAMKDAEIIKGNIDGSYTCYCLDYGKCQELRSILNKLFSSIKNCC